MLTRPDHNKLEAVLILLQEKSMLILVGPNGESCLLESHTHFGVGPLLLPPGLLKSYLLSTLN